MSESTQCDRLLAYLLDRGHINPMEAWNELGIYRLGARIFDLKPRVALLGYEITTVNAKVNNRWGETCRVGEYRLVPLAKPAPIEQMGLLEAHA